MGTQLILSAFMLTQAVPASTVPPPAKAQTQASAARQPSPAGQPSPAQLCDARPYQRLVGRTISDLLTTRLPPNTRVYRIDDPQTEVVQQGRLTVELNRSTRVRRVYCS